jgi:hypothetical protein
MSNNQPGIDDLLHLCRKVSDEYLSRPPTLSKQLDAGAFDGSAEEKSARRAFDQYLSTFHHLAKTVTHEVGVLGDWSWTFSKDSLECKWDEYGASIRIFRRGFAAVVEVVCPIPWFEYLVKLPPLISPLSDSMHVSIADNDAAEHRGTCLGSGVPEVAIESAMIAYMYSFVSTVDRCVKLLR